MTVVIVGAAMGGLRTAEALRKSGYCEALVMMGDETHLPYNRPPLSKDVLSTTVSHEAVAFPVRAEVADVTWMLGSAVTSVDLSAHTVTTQLGVSQGWSALVIATGLRPRRLDLPPLAGRHAVRSLDDAIALRAELRPGARVVVAGSGFLGCELAATATKLGCMVTVVTPSEEPMVRPLGRQLAGELRRRLEIEGVEFVTSTSLDGLVGVDSLTHVIVSGGREIRADVLVDSNVEICAAGTPGADVVVGAVVVATEVVDAVVATRFARTFMDRRAESAGADMQTTAAASPSAQPAIRRRRRRLSFISSGWFGLDLGAAGGVVRPPANGGGP